MDRVVRKFGFGTAVAFVLLLALAGAIWGAEFILQRMDLSLGSWVEAIILFLLVAMAFGAYSARKIAAEEGPPVRLHVLRPQSIPAKDDINARSRLVNLPYAIDYEMELILNDDTLPDPDIVATVIGMDRLIHRSGDEWMIVTLELVDPNDFERLGKSGWWEEVRGKALKDPPEKHEPAPGGEAHTKLGDV